jgi:hypothetical protein
LYQRDCIDNTTKLNNESCEVIRCWEDTKKCERRDDGCFPLLAIGLAAGAIGGIIAAAIIGFLLLGGATTAAAYSQATNNDSVFNTNPIFQGSGMSGTNTAA